ncbi:hypothetical protein T439DRAFT_335465 [Meredithblackwellia eburnea MCA 4105]
MPPSHPCYAWNAPPVALKLESMPPLPAWNAPPVVLKLESMPPLPTTLSLHQLEFGAQLNFPEVFMVERYDGLKFKAEMRQFSFVGGAVIKLVVRRRLYQLFGNSVKLDTPYLSNKITSYFTKHYSLQLQFLAARPCGTQQRKAATIFRAYVGALILQRDTKIKVQAWNWVEIIFSEEIMPCLKSKSGHLPLDLPSLIVRLRHEQGSATMLRAQRAKRAVDSIEEEKLTAKRLCRSTPSSPKTREQDTITPTEVNQGNPSLDFMSGWSPSMLRINYQQLPPLPIYSLEHLPPSALSRKKCEKRRKAKTADQLKSDGWAHLGDAYLEVHVSSWLFSNYKGIYLAQAVRFLRNDTFSFLAVGYGFHRRIVIPPNIKLYQKGMADMFEAYVGYLTISSERATRKAGVLWLDKLFSEKVFDMSEMMVDRK